MDRIGALAGEYWTLYGLRALQTLLAVVVILVAAKVLRVLAARLTRRLLQPKEGVHNYELRLRRSQTLVPLALEVERYVIYFLVVVTILAQFGINTGALLASVGVVGLALGFGAQELVKDVISGFFLLFDGLVAVGDVVKLDDSTAGAVELVGLRTTHLRDFSGLLWVVPNGDIRKLGNFNRGWMRAVVPVNVAREADIEKVLATMLEVGRTWSAENEAIVLEPPEVNSILSLGENAMQVRLVIKVKPMTQWGAERELLRRIKVAFDREGIEVPYPRRVVINKDIEQKAAA